MSKAETRRLMLMMQQQFYEDKRYHFLALGNGGQYTESQKSYAFELIDEYGVRATAKILQIPRRTLQRWCRENGVWVRRCPAWVYQWGERRRKRRAFWRRRGYS
jgi:hypothetical protein